MSSRLKDVYHVIVGGGHNLVCHWPRQGGIWNWGDDEILVGYIESPCEYKDTREVGHGLEGIWKRGYVRLRRSLDGGKTWTDAGKVFDNSLAIEEQRQILHLDEYREDNSPEREMIDMTSPDAILIMGRAFCGAEVKIGGEIVRENVTYCFRSPNRGYTWERVPSIIWPYHTKIVIELGNNYLKTNGQKLFAWLVGVNGVEENGKEFCSSQLYASDNHGISWDFYNEIYSDPTGRVCSSYPHIIVLPSGRWLCCMGCWHKIGGSRIRWTSVCHSDDKGLNWSEPRRIHVWSISPFPVLLKDRRLLVIYMRRCPDPTGLYAIVSEDEGLHWSKPLCIRDDIPAAGPMGPRGDVDGGYPVAIQMSDGRIFCAYYWQHDDPDVPWYGGRKFIGGTFFRL